MFGKLNIKLRMGLAVLVLCAALFMTAMPAMADYTADKPLTTYKSGTINGSMNYTIGDSYYSSKLWNDNDGNAATNDGDSYTVNYTVPLSSSPVLGRLYVYWTWSYLNDSNSATNTGVDANMSVTLTVGDEVYTLTKDCNYTDRKGSGTYNYPSGTYCYNVTNRLSSGSNTYVVNVTNVYPYSGNDANTTGDDRQSYCIQGIGLLTLDNGTTVLKDYWIAEGNDLTYTQYTSSTDSWSNGITPYNNSAYNATARAVLYNVSAYSNGARNSANLTTVVPSGGTPYNRLYVNCPWWLWAWESESALCCCCNWRDGLWYASPYKDLSWTTTNVDLAIKDGTNYIGIQNGNDYLLDNINNEGQMQAANAILVVTRN